MAVKLLGKWNQTWDIGQFDLNQEIEYLSEPVGAVPISNTSFAGKVFRYWAKKCEPHVSCQMCCPAMANAVYRNTVLHWETTISGPPFLYWVLKPIN